MTVNEIFQLIPENIFDDLAVETKVDHQVKKLSGETIFKLILFSMLNSEKLSLRVMESFLTSAKFKSFAQTELLESKYNSIRDRICTINAAYFEKLFETIFTIYNKELQEEKSLSKTDSTYVTLAAKLFMQGLEYGGDKNKRYIKYSIGLKGSLPCTAKVFTEQSYISEEIALAEIINEADWMIDSTVVFDRGLQSRNSFDKFSVNGKYFITRANPNIQHIATKNQQLGSKPESSTVTIIDDSVGFLSNKKGKKTSFEYRILTGTIDSSGETICFVTNLLKEDAYTIAQWYKQRWEIEIFFKFIKQHLNVKHLVSRNENGIKVMLYMTMILATLIIVYKKLNNIKGFKTCGQRPAQEQINLSSQLQIDLSFPILIKYNLQSLQ